MENKSLKEVVAGLTDNINEANELEAEFLNGGYFTVITKVYICGELCYRVIAMEEK